MTDLVKVGLTIPEAVRISGVSRSALYVEIAEGRLKARKLGRRTLILREDLEGFLKALPTAVNAVRAA